jgi:hypothetical protein
MSIPPIGGVHTYVLETEHGTMLVKPKKERKRKSSEISEANEILRSSGVIVSGEAVEPAAKKRRKSLPIKQDDKPIVAADLLSHQQLHVGKICWKPKLGDWVMFRTKDAKAENSAAYNVTNVKTIGEIQPAHYPKDVVVEATCGAAGLPSVTIKLLQSGEWIDESEKGKKVPKRRLVLFHQGQ